jgi:adenine-specific DNA-methyltransferase
MSALAQLQDLFRDLFQLDLADLDFGIYRLLRLKRDEVEAFLTEQLPRRVAAAFQAAAGEERADLESDVDALAVRIQHEVAEDALLPSGEVGPDFRETKVKAARDLIAAYEAKRHRLQSVQASDAQQAEVFNHLYAFFSRYYEAGDFIPRRRYGAREAYAIPYNGEETFFYWANKDQHYVKTGEVFRDYAFTVDTLEGPRRVRFVLTAASLPPGNTKGDTRYFFPLPDEASWDAESQTFRLPFHYRLPTEREVEKHGKNSRLQEAVLQASLRDVLKAVQDTALATALGAAVAAVEERGDERISLLLRRLRHFARRNTTDYFIHRDLEGFLKRELEFYLKDQVLHLADLEGALEGKRRTLRVIRQIAEEIITFLAQIEDVQKRLFEKRKFVLRTDYLVPIMKVPRDLWKEVLANKAQIAAWKALFAIEPRKDLFNRKGRVNEQFLAEHQTLVVDTAHFGPEFKDRLLAAFDDLHDATDGLLIRAENYQALRLLEPKYAGKVKCIYIDPPYNTGSDEFVYKDRYQHSTWLAMMEERLSIATGLLTGDGALFVSIDDIEVGRLRGLLESLFGSANALATIVWQKRYSRDNRPAFGTVHDYIIAFAKSQEAFALVRNRVLPNEESLAVYRNPNNDPKGRWRPIPMTAQGYRPNQMYSITTPTGVVHSPPPGRCWSMVESEFKKLLEGGRIWFGSDGSGQPNVIRYLSQVEGFVPWTWWPHDEVGHTDEAKKEIYQVLGKGSPFETPKPTRLLRRIAHISTRPGESVLDFFAGSGSTGHAVISLNRELGEGRKFVLVEMAGYFETVLIPRVQRVIYSPEWDDGKPKRPPTSEEVERSPRMVKVLRLESYEDGLHNLTIDGTLERETQRAIAYIDRLGPDAYRLRYMARLPLEASASMLNLAALEHPFRYTIEVLTEDGPRVETVDLVETFNFLYGLHVERLESWTNEKDGRSYRAVKGKTRAGQRVLVLWRDMENLNPVVERQFLEERLGAEGPFDEVLINGDTATPGIRSLDGLFKRLMEEGER